MAKQRYPWDRLVRRFDTILLEDVKQARQVSAAATVFVTRRLGPGAKVVCTTVPDGVVVCLVYVPPIELPEDPEPQSAPRPTISEGRGPLYRRNRVDLGEEIPDEDNPLFNDPSENDDDD